MKRNAGGVKRAEISFQVLRSLRYDRPAPQSPLGDEIAVRIVEKHRYPEPGERHAVENVGACCDGMGHLRLVLSTLAETDNNKGQLDEVLSWPRRTW